MQKRKEYKNGKALVELHFGQSLKAGEEWKKIVAEADEEKRHVLVDQLLESVQEEDISTSSFFKEDEIISTGEGRGFKLNDRELYYLFFDLLKNLNDQNVEHKISDANLILTVVKETIKRYAGSKNYVNADGKVDESVRRKVRLSKTERIFDEETGDIDFPSISAQRGLSCMLCTEKAAAAHNLWLLCGKTSYFCSTNCDQLGVNQAESNDAYGTDSHNFTIFENDGKFVLCDLSMNNVGKLQPDCIEKLLSGYGLQVSNVENPGFYAPNEHETEQV